MRWIRERLFCIPISPAYLLGATMSPKVHLSIRVRNSPSTTSWIILNRNWHTAKDHCGNLNTQSGTYDFSGMIGLNYLTANGTNSTGIDYLFDPCSQTVRVCIFPPTELLLRKNHSHIFTFPMLKLWFRTTMRLALVLSFLKNTYFFIILISFWIRFQREFH